MRTEVQKYLAGKFASALAVKSEEVKAALMASEKTAVTALETQIRATESRRRKWSKIQALYDVGPPPPTHVLLRGNESTPGAEVSPGFLRVLCATETQAAAATAPTFAGTSGRRAALARWLTRADSRASALLARVMVNRVWKHLYGEGIVPTPDNFGAQGQPPTHPELLEWLSSELIAGGWRLKPILRLMTTSTAYRQASRREPSDRKSPGDPEAIDPGNQLLWKMRLRRLEAEAVRDSILATSGDLDTTSGGPPIPIKARPDGMVTVAPDGQTHPAQAFRRSVYLTARRAYNVSLLTVFDQPLIATNCLKRNASALPSQSLFMINDAFLAEQAEHFARRVERSTQPSRDDAAALAFRLAVCRKPNPQEISTCRELLQCQTDRFLSCGHSSSESAHRAMTQLCLTLFNTSEFLFAE
jgi:hypothetical protein